MANLEHEVPSGHSQRRLDLPQEIIEKIAIFAGGYICCVLGLDFSRTVVRESVIVSGGPGEVLRQVLERGADIRCLLHLKPWVYYQHALFKAVRTKDKSKVIRVGTIWGWSPPYVVPGILKEAAGLGFGWALDVLSDPDDLYTKRMRNGYYLRHGMHDKLVMDIDDPFQSVDRDPFQSVDVPFVVDDGTFERIAKASSPYTEFALALLSARYDLAKHLSNKNKYQINDCNGLWALDLESLRRLHDCADGFYDELFPAQIFWKMAGKVKDEKDLPLMPEHGNYKKFLEMAIKGQWPEDPRDLQYMLGPITSRKSFSMRMELLKRTTSDKLAEYLEGVPYEFPDDIIPDEIFAKVPIEDLIRLASFRHSHIGALAYLTKSMDVKDIIGIVDYSTMFPAISLKYMGKGALTISTHIYIRNLEEFLWVYDMGIIRKVSWEDDSSPNININNGILMYGLHGMLCPMLGNPDQLDLYMMLFYMTDDVGR